MSLVSCRKFQKETLSVAMNTAPPDAELAQRRPSIIIRTSIEACTSSLLISTTPVHVHIFRTAPSFAAAMSGKAFQKQAHQASLTASTPFKVRWQSGKLTQAKTDQITVYVDCPAKQVDAVTDGKVLHAKAQLQDQVLTFIEKRDGVKLARKSAEVNCSLAKC